MRKLSSLTAINALGNGLFATFNIIYYTQFLGFSIGFVSAALFGATLLAIAGDLVSGRVSDRRSPKPVLLTGLMLSAVAVTMLVFVRSPASFLVTMCLISFGQGLCMSSNTALIRRLARDNPALTRASLRSLLTIGITLGAVGAGGVMAIETQAAFSVALLVDSATFLIAAALLWPIRVPPAPQGMPGRPNPVLPDPKFAIFSLANGLINIYLHAMSFAVPLWMVRNHPSFLWIAGVLVALNSLLAAALQVPASSGITSVPIASRRLVVGTLFIAISYIFFVSGWSHHVWLAGLALLAFLLLSTVGEVFYAAGSMELLFRMAPEHLQGQYGAFYGISNGLMAALAPVILGFAIASSDGWAWWIIAGITIGLGLVIRWAGTTSTDH